MVNEQAALQKKREELAATVAKEPWEMKQSAWTDGHIKSPGMHRERVRRALAAGKTVPPEVLEKYPDLANPGKLVVKPMFKGHGQEAKRSPRPA